MSGSNRSASEIQADLERQRTKTSADLDRLTELLAPAAPWPLGARPYQYGCVRNLAPIPAVDLG